MSDEDTEEPGTEPGTEPSPGQPAGEPHDPTGLELARSIARGLAGQTRRRTTRSRSWRRTETQSSGAHADGRDPQLIDLAVGRIIGEQGWEAELRVHGVFSRWGAIVGHEVAEHVTPESFADGRLVVRTDSTAWATQMKMLAAEVVRRLNEVLGEETVRVIDVVGPQGPSWNRGRLRVKGRGPRDTYG